MANDLPARRHIARKRDWKRWSSGSVYSNVTGLLNPSLGLNITHENDSHNFLHFANLALLLYIKLFQDRLNPYLKGHLLNRFGEYRFDV
ncbi:MAG TPA: hypothetical protein VKG02_21870, partial [Blastocatellia bacterium]|nr:hypothetical protein [Blastocatellia bacterium]